MESHDEIGASAPEGGAGPPPGGPGKAPRRPAAEGGAGEAPPGAGSRGPGACQGSHRPAVFAAGVPAAGHRAHHGVFRQLPLRLLQREDPGPLLLHQAPGHVGHPGPLRHDADGEDRLPPLQGLLQAGAVRGHHPAGSGAGAGRRHHPQPCHPLDRDRGPLHAALGGREVRRGVVLRGQHLEEAGEDADLPLRYPALRHHPGPHRGADDV